MRISAIAVTALMALCGACTQSSNTPLPSTSAPAPANNPEDAKLDALFPGTGAATARKGGVLGPWRVCNGRFESVARNYYDFNGGYGAIRVVSEGQDAIRTWIRRGVGGKEAYENYQRLTTADFGGSSVRKVVVENGIVSFSYSVGYGGDMRWHLVPTSTPGRYEIKGTMSAAGDFTGRLDCS